MNHCLSRRSFLRSAGALVLAFDLPAGAADGGLGLPGDLKQNPKIASWLRIEATGTVRLLTGKVELGQGILTAFGQICCDELDIRPNRLVITSGDTTLVPYEGPTAGSLSMMNGGSAIRQVSADARFILLMRAATKLGTDASRITIADGTIGAPDGQRITYWDLVSDKDFAIDAPGTAPHKRPDARTLVGTSAPRLDIPAKVYGQRVYLHDLRPDGMLHGRVVRPPAYGATLDDVAAIDRAMPGIVQTVRDGSFLAVIAEREEQAIAAASLLRDAARWRLPATAPDWLGIYDWLLSQPTKDVTIRDTPAPTGATTTSVRAEYRKPYLMHGSIGPSVAIATLGMDGTMVVQTHSQTVFETRGAIAMLLGMEKEKVRLQHEQGSGCYGHNGTDDVAADAALLARAMPGRPVRVQWSRSDEHRWEPYNSAMVMRIDAKVDAAGDVADWKYDLWSTSHGARPENDAGNLLNGPLLEKPFAMPSGRNAGPPNYAADRNAIAAYDFPGQRVVTHFIPTFAARASSTRSLGAFSNVFAVESFMDELALRAGADPIAYRLRQIRDERARAVMQKAADAFGWAAWKREKGHGRGFAYARYKNLAAFTAVALEVAVDRATGNVRVLRVVVANDAGEIVNPDGVRNQIEGGVIQSLSWSLKEQVRFGPAGVASRDWETYPILTFSEVPPVDVLLLDRPATPFLGTGEASQGPTAAALANAVADATGVRIRELPLTQTRVKAALVT